MFNNLFINKKLHLYTLKEFIKILLLLTYGVFMLVFLIDLLEFSSKIQKYNLNILMSLKLVFFKTPLLIESMFQFIILIASILTLAKLSSTNELTIIYSSKTSLWTVLKQQIIFVVILGFLDVYFLNSIFINLGQKSKVMQVNMIEKEDSDYITNRYGIWFNQVNDNENTIIRAERAYLDNLLFKDILLIKTVDNKFDSQIVADSLQVENNEFVLKNVYITKKDKNMEFLNIFKIDTKLTEKFLKQKIQNEYQNIDTIPFRELNGMIKNFKESGLDSKKFVIKKINYLLMPFVYALMVMLSGVFACLLNNRLGNTFMVIGITILSGLVIFIFQNILFELGTAGIINIFYSTFFPMIIFFLVVLISMINKIELQNF